MSLGKTLVKTGHLTPQKLQEIEKRAESFVAELEKSPKLLAEAMEKLGFNPLEGVAQSVERNWPDIAGKAVIYGGLAGGAELGIQGVKALTSHFHKAHAFKNMMEHMPELSQFPDQNRLQHSFDTLYRFNPAYASDPLVAGNYMRTMMESERMDPNVVGKFISDYATHRKTQPDTLGFFSGISGKPYDPHEREKGELAVDKARADAETSKHKSTILSREATRKSQ